MNEQKLRVRFAPSPTGELHVGNVRAALFNYLLAKHSGGTFVLRVEDTDSERSTEESVGSLLEDLKWLGIPWDEGFDRGGDFGPYRQTERYGIYKRYLNELIEKGNAYPCFCSIDELKKERQKTIDDGIAYTYSKKCRNIPYDDALTRMKSEAYVVRLKVKDEDIKIDDKIRGEVSIKSSSFGDFVLCRSDGSPTYNFAVVIDDYLMGINLVMRGEDHLPNTPKQILVYKTLGWKAPSFAHLPMILGPDGSKMSKRHGDTSVSEFRDRGYLPDALVNYLALLGWSSPDGREILSLSEIISLFSVERVNHSAAIFDYKKLRFINKEYLKRKPVSGIVELCLPYLKRSHLLPDNLPDGSSQFLEAVIALAISSMETIDDIVNAAKPVFEFNLNGLESDEVREIVKDTSAVKVIQNFYESLPDCDITADVFRACANKTKQETSVKGKALFHPIRVAITANASGPELDKLIPAIELGSSLFPDKIIGVKKRISLVINALPSK